MVRLLLVALALQSSAAFAVENLDVAPIGTAVTGAFDLAGKLIPLPEGTYYLAARTTTEAPLLEGSAASPKTKMVHVFLAYIRPPRMRAAVYARAALKPDRYLGHSWSGEPCKKEGTLFRADLTGSHGEDENCLLVDHTMLNLGPRAQGFWRDAAAWLSAQNVQVPVPVVITANVTRFQNTQYVAASYSFNPRMYGCNAPVSRSYTDSPWHKDAIGEDPQRVRFVQSVTTWGKVVQTHFDKLVAGQPSTVDKRPAIYNCSTAQVVLSHTP